MTARGRNRDRLYELLPALYRIADADQADELERAERLKTEPRLDQDFLQLKALLQLVTDQADALRGDTQRLWDDFFIETAQSWVVPYIGELVGNNPLHPLDLTAEALTAQKLFTDLAGPDRRPSGAIPTRADVAKTIYYRRRKGTPAMLEELAHDVTGWDAHVVEFFTLLDWNQHLEHVSLSRHGCPDLRAVDVGDRVCGPWDTTAHTVDVRQINEWDGWYNIPNVGFFLWRLNAYPLTKVKPRAIGGGTSLRCTFSPLGQNVPLFCSGERESGPSQLATEFSVETPIRAAAFFEDLKHIVGGTPKITTYYDPSSEGSLVIFADGNAVGADEVICANLESWSATTAAPAGKFLIDVTRGRLIVPAERSGAKIRVSYHYGFSAAMGGGEYDRAKWLVRSEDQPIVVTGGGAALATAIAGRGQHNLIEIDDDETYELGNPIQLAAGETLTIQAKNKRRPHVHLADGLVAVRGAKGATLTLGGILVEGGLEITEDLAKLRLLHTTLVPGRSVEQETATNSGPSLVVRAKSGTTIINTGLEVQIAFSIVGSLVIPSQIAKLTILDSIVDGVLKEGDEPGVAIADEAQTSGPPAQIERSSIFGSSRFLKLELASETIFTGPVNVDQHEQGCLRFCYVPPLSQTPQRYRCQPTLEIQLEKDQRKAAAKKSGTTPPVDWETVLQADVEDWLVPSFESLRYGDPDFAQLRRTCPSQVRTGSEDGSEMGAFCVLKQPQRESNLRIRLEEYLPVGLEAGIVYVT